MKDQAKTLQLWAFPEKQDVTPRYDQKSFDIENQINTFVNVVSPEDKNDGNALIIVSAFFQFDGEIEVDHHTLNARDTIAITDLINWV